MFKSVADDVWVIDAEWVPDPETGRRLHRLPAGTPDAEVLDRMWDAAGATEDAPRPFLKTILCRVVSIAAVKRRRTGHHPVQLELRSLPDPGEGPLPEATLLGRFLESVGKVKPQLVGFNLRGADLPILMQRAMAHGLSIKEFCQRPERPWEGVDYFHNASEGAIDLMEVFGVRGRGNPSLSELAAAAGIPGKMDTTGSHVHDLWLAGDLRRIVEYNEFDAVTTYLLWLRAAHLGGFLSVPEFRAEERQLEAMLRARIALGATHLELYLARWQELRSQSGAPADLELPL